MALGCSGIIEYYQGMGKEWRVIDVKEEDEGCEDRLMKAV
jgi:hypothetical protein